MLDVQCMDVDSSSDDEVPQKRRRLPLQPRCTSEASSETFAKLVADSIDERILAHASKRGPSLKVEEVIPLICDDAEHPCEVLVFMTRRVTRDGPTMSKMLNPSERSCLHQYLERRARKLHLQLRALNLTTHKDMVAVAKFVMIDCRSLPPSIKDSLMLVDSTSSTD